jgi:hypothetical protein
MLNCLIAKGGRAFSVGCGRPFRGFSHRVCDVFCDAPDELPVTPCGPLAQLAEQLTLNQRVPGSSPGRLTTYFQSVTLFVGESIKDPL